MPHVASDLKSQLLNRILPQAGKPAFSPASPAATPFDSILNETARPAPEPRRQRASDDNSPRADRPKPADRPDRAAKADDSARPADAKTDSRTDTASAADTGKTADDKTSDSETAGQATTGDDVKAAADTAEQTGEAKPADAAVVAAVAVVIDPAMAAASAQADANSATPAEVKTNTSAIAATTVEAAATAVTAQPEATEAAASTELTKAAPDALATKTDKSDKAEAKTDKKASTDKPAAATAKFAGNAAMPLHAETTARAAESEPHKDSGAHARAEDTANTHRGAAPDPIAAATADNTATVAPKTADLTPPPAMTVQTTAPNAPANAATATTAAAPLSSTDQAVPISGVAFEITSKALAGKGQFDIRLDPPDLGRIHVRLDVDRDGNVITHMVADRTDTLDMLRKDTAGLERALQDAGLKTSDNSLQFSLRDQSANQQQNQSGNADTAHIVVDDEQLAANEPAQRNYERTNAPAGGLDIRV
ncbi:MAG: flagellar hook-length control protein FliK [Hyphomicrobiales bacterium]|nr:flagellar hook-length control protein FliK [Hyphomicrobiales bacterium]